MTVLPAIEKTEPEAAKTRASSVQIRVLVVDDEKDTCEFVALLLGREGYEVDVLTDPTQALEQLRQKTYHLVVLDMMMPVMTGSKLLEEIRKIDKDIAVIVSTAYPTVDTAVASLKLQASDYVQKPFEPESFLTTLRHVLAKKGLSADPEAELHRAIGRVIRDGRKGQDLTLKDLARRTGLSVSLLSQIERAESSASISSLFRIATALGLKMADLFGGY